MGAEKITITFKNGDQKKVDKGTSLSSLCLLNDDILAAYLNGSLCHLDQKIYSDCFIEWIKNNEEAGARVYQRSLCLLLFTALKELFAQKNVKIVYSVSNSFYVEPTNSGESFSVMDINQITDKMNFYITNNVPLKQIRMTKRDAIQEFQKHKQIGTINLINQLEQDEVTLYSCCGLVEFLYDPTCNWAGKVSQFEILLESNGFLLRFPDFKNSEPQIPIYQKEDKLVQAFIEEDKWAKSIQCSFFSDLNNYIFEGNFSELVQKSEEKHSRKIKSIATTLCCQSQNRRVICIAGPSSSGKTTFARRIQRELMQQGFSPLLISIDDYFKDRKDSPQNPDGTYDFEHIEALELDLFNRDLKALLSGQTVNIPTFNFLEGKKEYLGEQFTLQENGLIILEGIHGLNERLTYDIPRNKKTKIYVSALTQLALDNHNLISTSDSRLIRRIVRDYQFRGASAERTFGMWTSVREGEKKFIFPFQNDADILFNSATIYELAILKKWISPLLLKVSRDSEFNSDAQRILNFLSYFLEGDPEIIPENSIIREFIGLEEFKL